ncbi:MAG TPA: TIGR03557 family F420-dependent LLM class oxidoreductase [Mycobacteriales bacterium]|nr:TIGR03557 family F420-dependent LLM class oxidoreductase [Mycobacteriales bacterium]
MVRIGYFLSSEEHPPGELVRQARLAERSGFTGLWISDHFHPWNEAQGQAPFVWSTIGAISQVCRLPVTTAVTCPTMRMHPALVAQAAATSSVLLDGRFALGVGTGEALNEHILGDRWPGGTERLEMLAEAVTVMRRLWSGRNVNHRGTHYTVADARLYTVPEQPPPVYVSAFGPRSAALAGKLGDGMISVLTDASLVDTFRDSGGRGKVVQGGFKACHGSHEDEARRVAHRLWGNTWLPGELGQTLPLPRHFEQATPLVTEDTVDRYAVCGSDPGRHVDRIRAFVEAGYDEVYVSQIGPTSEEFFRFYAERVLPEFAAVRGTA